MKTKLTLLLVVLLPFAAHAADDLSAALQKGLFEEEANQNLPAAIKAYESLLSANDEQRKLAATALFRLGECYRKLGRTNDAVTQYQRLLRDYADQNPLATLSRQNLRGLGEGVTDGAAKSSTAKPLASAEAEELARTERILVQLEGRDLSQVRRLLPTLVPDADFESYDRQLTEAQEKLRTSTAEEREKWVLNADVNKMRLQQRRDEVKRILQERIALLRAEVNKQQVEAKRAQMAVANEMAVLTPAQVEAQRLLIERLELEVKTAEAEVARANELTRQGVAPSGSADKEKANLLELRRQLVLARNGQAVAPSVQPEGMQSEALLKHLQALSRSELVAVLPTVVSDPLLNSLLEQLSQAGRKQVELESKFGSGHPDVKANRTAMEVLERQVYDRTEGIMKGLAIKAAALKPQAMLGFGSATSGNEEDQEIRRTQALIKNSPDLINAVNVEIEKVRSGELMVPKNGTLLHNAANQGQLTVAKFLLEHGADVGARDELGRTPLHRAAGNGHKAMVELLLANKADANAKVSHSSDTGSTSLNLAMKKGYRSVCEALLERGADPNLGDGSGGSPIYSAVFARDEASLRLLIAKGARVNPYLEMKSDTPLHNATTPAIAKILIEAGAPVDALNGANQSPLHAKAREGNLDVLEILLAAGANPSLKDSVGQTPLHLAAVGWNANVITPLIAKGANPNERDSAGGTPLDALIRSGYGRNTDFARQIETLRALLAGGVDPNLIQRGGSPHLYRAVADGLEEQAEMLLKAGADPNAKYVYSDGNGWQTSLIVALQGTKHPERAGQKTRSMDLVKLLLDYKADPNLSNGSGASPLWFAMVHGSRDFAERAPFVEALLQRGANIEGRDSDGRTSLAVAVELGMKEMTELLIKHKADPNAKAGNGKSPLHFAAANRNMELVDVLLSAGADPNALDPEGRSALDYVKVAGSFSRPGSIGMALPSFPVPSVPSQPSSQPKETTQSELADRLRKAGARDWAPRPGLITVTRRSTGASQVIFTKGTNDWNRYSLLEVIGHTYFGSDTKFPFPDFSKITITRADASAAGGIREFTGDLAAALAKDGCKADQWLEWGDLVEIPEGVHRLDEKWSALREAEADSFEKCVARKVTLRAGAMSKELELKAGRNWSSLVNSGVLLRYQRQNQPRLRDVVLNSGLLLTSSDTTRVKVTRPDTAGGLKEWTFDLSKEPSAGNDLWLRDGDIIEVPEK